MPKPTGDEAPLVGFGARRCARLERFPGASTCPTRRAVAAWGEDMTLRSPHGAKRNAGAACPGSLAGPFPDFASLHPGYGESSGGSASAASTTAVARAESKVR